MYDYVRLILDCGNIDYVAKIFGLQNERAPSDPPERSIGDLGYFWWILNKGKGGRFEHVEPVWNTTRKSKFDTLFQKPFDNPLSVELARPGSILRQIISDFTRIKQKNDWMIGRLKIAQKYLYNVA